MIYAGIGSRETPPEILELMFSIAYQLAKQGWLLRSGHAKGADMAFERGCSYAQGRRQIYLPWEGFNGASNKDPNYIPIIPDSALLNYAGKFHPAWHRCSYIAKKLHARNVYQIKGHTKESPLTNMVICWTKDGKGGGGTGQALRIAQAHNIPVFDLAKADTKHQLNEYLSLVDAAR